MGFHPEAQRALKWCVDNYMTSDGHFRGNHSGVISEIGEAGVTCDV